MARRWRRSKKEKQKRRKVLPGFPWIGKFRTKEEIDAYFAGDKIQCLLCGKWYKKLSGPHLLSLRLSPVRHSCESGDRLPATILHRPYATVS